MTESVPVRIGRETLDTLDLLVNMGIYKNRSEAIRELMKKGLEGQDRIKELDRIIMVIESLDKAGKIDLSGLKLERERF
jgi:Arc/MetJ-type ribon-helix-helix transcriptional regulator